MIHPVNESPSRDLSGMKKLFLNSWIILQGIQKLKSLKFKSKNEKSKIFSWVEHFFLQSTRKFQSTLRLKNYHSCQSNWWGQVVCFFPLFLVLIRTGIDILIMSIKRSEWRLRGPFFADEWCRDVRRYKLVQNSGFRPERFISYRKDRKRVLPQIQLICYSTSLPDISSYKVIFFFL